MQIESPSRLDLTGQASEDETAYIMLTSCAQNYRDDKPKQTTNQSNYSNQYIHVHEEEEEEEEEDDEEGILAKYLPSPIDLWEARTLKSLLLLPLVLILYILLKLPLHYNSTTEKNLWKGRAKEVDTLSSELNAVGNELNTVKGNQAELRGEVSSLRLRLSKMKERRDRREQLKLRIEEKEGIRIEKQKQQYQKGIGVGPITNVSIVKSKGVKTFLGCISNDDSINELRKKDD